MCLDVKANERGAAHTPRGVWNIPVSVLDISMSRQVGWLSMEDEVDRLVAAWQSERPDLDVTPLQVLSRVSRLARHLERARQRVFSAHDLEAWEFDVLTALRRAGEPY